MATKTRQLADYLVSGGLSDFSVETAPLQHVKPHIQPGILQPAVAGKDLSGTALGGSYVYGVAHTDGHKYYYTDIQGSKPIKDPRIGSHFGSQRHRCTSLQLLEQETATHGKDVFSIDGREWMRIHGTGGRPIAENSANGNAIVCGDAGNARAVELEITGYFNKANIVGYVNSYAGRKWESCFVNGTEVTTDTSFVATVTTPLGDRYVAAGSLVPIEMGTVTSPQITTIRLVHDSDGETNLYAIELITQDTTSTATKSKVQIPSQDVVSYGKKFTVGGSSASTHYDPFNGFTNSTTLHSAVVDTATSLGLSSAPGLSASWAISGSNNIRPYNGGRVVKWVDSSGVIKTSVNMMPPNAQNISGGVAGTTEVTTPSATNATYTPIFSDDAIDHSQAEVAKTFHFREFGNGAANGNAAYADASMLNTTADDIAYVMDDGLTSLSGDDVKWGSGQNELSPIADGDFVYLTFIGTGITLNETYYGAGQIHLAQNLPFGTHILKVLRGSGADPSYTIDGVSFGTISNGSYANFNEVSFHQPKLPPIPEDAVIISDYMLMADFVPATTLQSGSISKGVRYQSGTRDIFYDAGGAITQNFGYGYLGGQFVSYYTNNATSEAKFTAFGHAYGCAYVRGTNREANLQARLDDANYSYVADDIYDTSGEWDDTNDDGTLTKDGGAEGTAFQMYGIKNQTLGIHTFGDKKSSGSEYNAWTSFEVATPIHTSSHYQTFETPFLHELVGGDRNLEQTNLVVTPDGKTWEQISSPYKPTYPKAGWHLKASNKGVIANGLPFNQTRGLNNGDDSIVKNCVVVPIDATGGTLIIQITGWYQLAFIDIPHGSQGSGAVTKTWYKNGSNFMGFGMPNRGDAGDSQEVSGMHYLKKGDEIHCSHYWTTYNWSSFFSGTYLGT